MTCSSCKYLKEDKKYEGNLCGAKYYCEKIKDYVDGSNCCCASFEKSYSRSNYMCDEIYKEGDTFSDDDRPIWYFVFILILIIIVGLILNMLEESLFVVNTL